MVSLFTRFSEDVQAQEDVVSGRALHGDDPQGVSLDGRGEK